MYFYRYLGHNNISVVHPSEFNNLSGVLELDMGGCNIHEIKGSPFSVLPTVSHLYLDNNQLTDESLDVGLKGMYNLTQLDLSSNHLQTVPNFANSEFPFFAELLLSNNNISKVTRDNFLNMKGLKKLYLSMNPLVGFPENDNTFTETPKLEILKLENTLLTHLPNLTFLPRLTQLFVNNARLSSIPDSICCSCAYLEFLEARNNILQDLPVFNCRKMVDVDLAYNIIKTVNRSMLHGMRHIRVLDLSGNMIKELDYDFFNESADMEHLRIGGNRITELPDLRRMNHLIEFNASYNRIKEIKNGTFTEQIGMDILLLNNNDIGSVHENAFSVGTDLKQLDLSNNRDLSEWILPSGGFPHLAILSLSGLWDLHQVPSPFQVPRVKEVHYTYSYHCCIWKDYIPKQNDTNNINVDEGEIISQIFTEPTGIAPTKPRSVTDCEEFRERVKVWVQYNLTELLTHPSYLDSNCTVHVMINQGDDKQVLIDDIEEYAQHVSSRTNLNFVFEYTDKVICTPTDNPLTPCENLMDPWVLRVAIWAVWVLALLGNGTVLFVGIAAREKLESSEFLICNLAFADFCMGLYLVFLATVDVRTFGSGTFFQSALDWQLGPGCKSAGFIAIFSNILSVFVLVVLTMERVYTIASTFNQNEKKKKKVAMGICAVGWVLAAVVASLPFFGINSYNHVAVCLPYLTEDWLDKLYIGFLLSGNLVGFLIILVSYIYIFSSACKNTPSTHVPQRRKDIVIAASKIAVLILTAFLCWAPTALIGFLALGDVHLVTAAEAKYFLVFVFPLNACVNPFIYAIFTRRFRQKFASIFQRSNDKVTSFPPHHNMRLQRTQSAFTSEFQMSRVSSSGSRNPEEITKMRQSRRSNSLVVQYVDKNLTTPSPTFTPPTGCNLGRRASLPPGFGSTLNKPSVGGSKGSRVPCVPHCVLPFRLGSLYSSNTSSLPELQEESDMEQEIKSITSNSPVDLRPHPLTSSQESNLRRLSVVKEDEDEGEAPTMSIGRPCVEENEECDTFSESSSEDYSDASDSIQFLTGEGGTDLDFIMCGGANATVEAQLQSVVSSTDRKSKDVTGTNKEMKRKPTRKASLEFLAVDVMLEVPHSQRKASSCSDMLSLSAMEPWHSPFVTNDHLHSASSEEKLASPPIPDPASITPSETTYNADPSPSNLHNTISSISPESPDTRICSSATPENYVSELSSTSKLRNPNELESNSCMNSTSCNYTDIRQGLVLGLRSKLKSPSQENASKNSTMCNHLSSTTNCPPVDEQCLTNNYSVVDIIETDL